MMTITKPNPKYVTHFCSWNLRCPPRSEVKCACGRKMVNVENCSDDDNLSEITCKDCLRILGW